MAESNPILQPSSSSILEYSSSTVNPTPIPPFVIAQYENPYFLHNSNNTNLVIVSDLLTESNYTSWNRAFLLGLTVKNKVGFVDGTLTCSTNAFSSSWIICNSIVTAWILNSISKEIAASICFAPKKFG